MEEDHNRLFNNIRKNKHNNLTTLFYLGKRQLARIGDKIGEKNAKDKTKENERGNKMQNEEVNDK